MPDDYAGPVGHYRPVDLSYYRDISEDVVAVLADNADAIRVASLDEAYLDVTERTSWDEATSFGRRLKEAVEAAVGVPASVGLAPTRGVAKIASDHDKPDGLTVVPPDRVRAFLTDLPVEDLHGVGPVTADALRSMGCETIGDVADVPPTTLVERFGDRGRELAERARGQGSAEVVPQGRPKSLSRESSLGDTGEEFQTVKDRVRTLAQAVAERAANKGAQYRTVGIKVVEPPFDVNTRETSFGGPFADADLVEATALELLEEFADTSIRKVGVRVSKLDFAADQQALTDYDGELTDSEDNAVSFERQGRLGDFEPS